MLTNLPFTRITDAETATAVRGFIGGWERAKAMAALNNNFKLVTLATKQIERYQRRLAELEPKKNCEVL